MPTETTVVLTEEQQFCLQGCRGYQQYFAMRKRFEEGVCTFCSLPEENVVLFDDEHVHAWHVPEKYMRKDELAVHFLIAPKRHVRRLEDLSEAEAVSMHRAVKFMFEKFPSAGGIRGTRFGDMRFNAGTVDHLHENIYVPSGQAEFRVPVFKDPSDRKKNEERAAGFARMYEAGETP